MRELACTRARVARAVALRHVDDADQYAAALTAPVGNATVKSVGSAVRGAKRGVGLVIRLAADRGDDALAIDVITLRRPIRVDGAQQFLAAFRAKQMHRFLVHVDGTRNAIASRTSAGCSVRLRRSVTPEASHLRSNRPTAEIKLPERHRHGLEQVAIAELALLQCLGGADARRHVAAVSRISTGAPSVPGSSATRRDDHLRPARSTAPPRRPSAPFPQNGGHAIGRIAELREQRVRVPAERFRARPP